MSVSISSSAHGVLGTIPRGTNRGCWKILLAAYFTIVVACLLCRSGDVETNPGPECEPVTLLSCTILITATHYPVLLNSENLKKLCDLLWNAKEKWLDLGFQLNIPLDQLKLIKEEYSDINACFREMLMLWLEMTNPIPSWDGLISALSHDSVRCGDLATEIKEKLAVPVQEDNSSAPMAGKKSMSPVPLVQISPK